MTVNFHILSYCMPSEIKEHAQLATTSGWHKCTELIYMIGSGKGFEFNGKKTKDVIGLCFKLIAIITVTVLHLPPLTIS
jgi:hypothetical protein